MSAPDKKLEKCVKPHMVDDLSLCTILGIDESYGKLLSEMGGKIRNHQTSLYHLERCIGDRAQQIEVMAGGTNHGRKALKEHLYSLGFTAECCEKIVSHIPDDFVDSQLPLYWALRYLRNAFQHHPLLAEHPRYIYQPEKPDVWFEETVGVAEDPACDGDVSTPQVVKIINISRASGKDEVSKLLKEGEIRDNCLFYHGTTYESAKSIVNNGIILTTGQKSQDFSSGDGFYVSETLESAKNWSRATWGPHRAVIVYRIRKQLLDAATGRDLTLLPKQQWEDVITLCRSGYANKRKKREILDGVDYIRGPMCRNIKDGVYDKRTPFGLGRDDVQVCLRSHDFAEKFGSFANILCVICY